MNTKLVLALCCAIGMSAIPFAGGHLTNPSGSATSAFFTGDNCRYAGGYDTGIAIFDDVIYPKNKGDTCPNLNAGVSGTYVIEPGGLVGSDAAPFTLSPLVTIAPNGYVAAQFIACDLEVLSFSGGEVGDILFGDPKADPIDLLLDETVVDGAPTGLVVPDGTWDDGGLGGACHRDIFANENLSTPGCSGTSHAEDGATGANVWIGAGCDFYRGNLGLVACFALAARGGTNLLQDCVDSTTCQVFDPSSCSPSFVGCGADGQIDALNYGEGGGSVQFAAGEDGSTGPFHSLGWLLDSKKKAAQWDYFGVLYPTLDVVNGCPAGGFPGAAAVTYVFPGVEANIGDTTHKTARLVVNNVLGADVVKESNGEYSYPNYEYTLPVGGWIDWTHDSFGEGTIDGTAMPYDGVTIGLCKIPMPIGPFATLGDAIEAIPNVNGDVLLTCPTDNSKGGLDTGVLPPGFTICIDSVPVVCRAPPPAGHA